MKDKWLKRDQKSETEYTERHPSYGSISISQVQGRGILFGSEVSHQHFISLTISEARRVVNQPREFVMPDRELVRVDMTHAQFAEMITHPNTGGGTPCTITRFCGDQGEPWVNERHGGRPSPPEPEPYTKKFKDVGGETIGKVSSFVKQAKEKSDRLFSGEDKPTKSNLKELQDALYMAQMNLDANLRYIMAQMEESIEKRMATAKGEFESFISLSLKEKGLEHLISQVPRLNTPEQKVLSDGELEAK